MSRLPLLVLLGLCVASADDPIRENQEYLRSYLTSPQDSFSLKYIPVNFRIQHPRECMFSFEGDQYRLSGHRSHIRFDFREEIRIEDYDVAIELRGPGVPLRFGEDWSESIYMLYRDGRDAQLRRFLEALENLGKACKS